MQLKSVNLAQPVVVSGETETFLRGDKYNLTMLDNGITVKIEHKLKKGVIYTTIMNIRYWEQEDSAPKAKTK